MLSFDCRTFFLLLFIHIALPELADQGLTITLALSLHAPNDEVRKSLMPIARTYALKDVLAACHYYFEKTGRRMTFEYSLVQGVNDNLDEARELAALIQDQHGHVNLIPVNPIKERNFVQSDKKVIENFKNILEKYRINVLLEQIWKISYRLLGRIYIILILTSDLSYIGQRK